jgi:acyl-coenzyme A thioesterase PaaI-like protein
MNLSRLLEQAAHSSWKLWFLNRILTRFIPFNAPHGVRIASLQSDALIATVPYKRRNWNHIKGIHACCIATVGEFSAGLQLLRSFDAKQYRLIMAKLEVTYHYQAKKALFAKTSFDKSQVNKAEQTLEDAQKVMLIMQTDITDTDGHAIATVLTTWQVKPWKAVRTKA